MPSPVREIPLRTVAARWGRIGCLGFGGPPVHIAMLRDLCVRREGWIEDEAFEDAIAATNLLPGPASSQLAILTAWRVGGGTAGGLVGGLAFVLPGLVAMVALAAVFLAASPPDVVRGAGAGAGAVVAAVAVHAGWGLLRPSWDRARVSRRRRWTAYVVLGAAAAILVGPWLVLVLLACGATEVVRLRPRRSGPAPPVGSHAWPLLLGVASGVGGLGAVAWTAFKVGALSYGGGFVIIPLMQADAVDRHHWMTDARFLDAVALGQVTPGPVVHTVAAVGYAAHGVGGALLAAVVAFAPSFALVLVLAPRFEALRAAPRLRAFLDGAGPAAIGAILGGAVPLALALGETWQIVLLGAGAVAMLLLRAPVVATLVGAGVVGAVLVAGLGAAVPG